MSAFRILIADDHEIVRQGIRSLIDNHPGWEVCAEAVDGRSAVEKTRELRPDLEVLEVGARGFLLKSDAARDLVSAIQALQRRTTFFTSSVAEMVLNGFLDRKGEAQKPSKDRLTPREREVVQLLAE